MDEKQLILPKGYAELLERLKEQIRNARVKAALSVNREMILLYWDIGRQIAERQQVKSWGKRVIEKLAMDIQKAFPGIEGFSPSNMWRMRAFYLAHPVESPILAQPVRELDSKKLAQLVRESDHEPNPVHPLQVLAGIPWGQNVVLVEKVKEPSERLWYARKTLGNGWSRNTLVHQIESGLYQRQGVALTNFPSTLPATQSDLAQNLLKDPYTFGFIGLSEKMKERDLERALLVHIRDFLLELGKGFAFLGSQFHLEVGDEDFYLDLLFYHTVLRCHIVIDLKIGAFKPEYAGKMGFYLTAVDEQLRHSDDHPPIGIILCKERNKVVVEYALRDTTKPMAVATYQLTEKLPKDVRGNLPSIEELETELRKDEDD